MVIYTWIRDLFWQTISDNDDIEYFAYLPDDLIENILSRLPAQSVFRCGTVCKKWWTLTSSPHFIELNQTLVKPLTLMHTTKNGYFELFVIDDKGRKKECNLGVVFEIRYAGACNGLVLLSSSHFFGTYYVHNPLSAKGRNITIRGSLYSHALGFYFHPLAKEYRILALRPVETGDEFLIYEFGTKMWRTIAIHLFQPSHYRTGYSIPCRDAAIVNRCLHWYLGGGIGVFDMISEIFSFRPAPVEDSYEGESYERGKKVRDLLVKEDRLCLYNVDSQRMVMDIWILEDYANWSWIKKYVVDLDWDLIKYPVERDGMSYDIGCTYIDVISIHKNEMMLFWKYRGLFSYDLAYKTIKKIHVKVDDIGMPEIDAGYGGYWGYRSFK